MAPENLLTVKLLGQPMISWGDKTITIQRKLARVIIYYLACQRTMIGRSDLVLMFWPESLKGRQQLRDLLSKLRAELPDPEILVTDRDWIGLNGQKITSDVLIFQDLCEQLSLPFMTIENRPLPEAIYQKMLSAVNMWQATEFLFGIGVLDSDELNEWIAETNRKLRFNWLKLMMRIAQHLITVGDLEGALTWFEKVSDYDKDYEFPQAIYLRMDTLYLLGRLTQAYELGQEYSEHIKSGWFEEFRTPFEVLMQKVEKERNQSTNRNQPTSRLSVSSTIPLIGRDDILQQIQWAYRRGNIIVLSGETGMGKTRILHEFVNRLTTPVTILSMEAVFSERDIAFHPILELLRQTMSMSDWQKIEFFWLAQLAPFLPELQGLIEKRNDLIGLIENQRLSIYESFRQVFMSLTGKYKLLFTLENAQWADEETIRLMAYLTQRRFFIDYANLIFISNLQDLMPTMADYQENFSWINQVALIRVSPLDFDALTSIGLYLLRTPLSEEHTRQLMEATGGNPLFVIETLQMILETPDQLAKKTWDHIPLSGIVQLVIRERLDRLSRNARTVLESAALIGVEFTFDYVHVMVDLSEDELVASLDELQNREIIQIISQVQQPIRYKFAQTFIHNVVLRGLSKTQKQILHRRLTNYFLSNEKEKQSADELATIGYHLGQAGRAEEAFQYWIEAADKYQITDLTQKANDAYEQAFLLSQNRNFEITEQQLFDLWIGWGELATKLNDYKSGTEYYQRAEREGLYRNSPLLIGSGLSGEGYLFLLRGLPGQAKQYLDRAAYHLKDGHRMDYIRTSIRKMLTHLYHFDLQASIDEYESIAWLESQLQTEKERLVFASLQSTLALTYMLAGKFNESETEANKSIHTSVQLNNPSLRIENEFSLGLGYFYQGLYKNSLEKLGLSIQIAESFFYWRFVLETLSVISRVYLALGKTYQCLESIQNGYALAKAYQFTGMHSILINSEGRLYVTFGKFEKAINFFEESIKFSENNRNILLNQMWIGLSKSLMGDFENGVALMQQVVHDVKKQQLIQLQVESEARLGLMLYLKGDVQNSLVLLEHVSSKSQEYGFAAAGTAYAYVRAQEALRSGNSVLAYKMAALIMQKATQEESPWLEWHALQIMIAAGKTSGNSVENYVKQKQTVLRTLNQSKPHNLNFSLDPDSPPLSTLV
jgi:tetratricopeptide (TPR) repeat protein